MAHSPIVDQQLAVFPGNHLRDKKEHNKINQLNLRFSCLGALTLGPLLFLIYINELPNCLLNCQPRMCPHDMHLTFAANTVSNIDRNEDLSRINNWFTANNLTLYNASKTEFMLIDQDKE